MIRIEIIGCDFNSRGLRIIDRRTGYFIRRSLSRCRSGDRIRQFMRFYLQQFRIEDHFSAGIVQVVVLCGNAVDGYFTEYRIHSHIRGDFRLRRYFFACIAFSPLLKDLSGNERFLRHGINRFARFIVLTEDGASIHIEYYGELILELRRQREIGIYGLSAFILCITDIPAEEFLAGRSRSRGQR